MATPSKMLAVLETVRALDAADLPGLVALQDDLETMIGDPGVDDPTAAAAVAAVCERAIDLINAVVMRETEDEAGTFNEVCVVLESLPAAAEGNAPDAASGGVASAEAADDAAAAATATGREDLDLELLESWLSATHDNLSTLEALAVDLEQSPDPESLGEARRIIHTIKGESGFLSLDASRDLCHEVETLIDYTTERDGDVPADQILELVDWLKRTIDALATDPHGDIPDHTDLLDRVTAANQLLGEAPSDEGKTPASGDASDRPNFDDPTPVSFPDDLGMDENLADFSCEAREHIAAAENSLLELEHDVTDKELINTIFRSFHTVKGVAGFMNLHPIVELAHEAETLLDHARNDKLTLDSRSLDLILRSCDLLTQLIGLLEGGPAPTVGGHAALIDALQRAVRGEAFDVPGRSPSAETDAPSGDAPAAAAPADAGGDATPATPAAPTGNAPTNTPAASAPGGKPAQRAVRVEQTVKVSTTRLDNLVTMVGELVIAQQMVMQDPEIEGIEEQRVQRTLSQVAKIIRDLQGVSMALSMVPVKGAFQKMARLVRDISAKSGKNIRFEMEGEDTELDRNVVEEIGDPLVHMVRNACDHGIEPPEERLAAGKPEQGVLTLRAYHQGGSIIIEIADDGRGLNRDRILAKAVERGLVPADKDPSEISDHDAYNMIFLPGFSTADKITDISGRGVGMDVVRRNIEALRGTAEIHSVPGQGSTFRLRLPLTMAIIDGMVVRVGGERFVVPTLAIEQSFRPVDDDLENTLGKGEMAMVRGNLLPIHRLKRVLALDEGVDELTEGLLLVLDSNGRRFCLAVDDILGQQQVVIKSLGEGVQPIQGVAGGAILGDGRVALILDVSGIVSKATEDAPSGAALAAASA